MSSPSNRKEPAAFSTVRKRGYAISKRILDLVGSSFALVISLPILAGTIIAIRMTLGSPVFFRQRRPGRNDHPFNLIKFRTMRPIVDGEQWPQSDAVRLSRLGKLLRSASIDELPTLWNVLVGDMSLVGPRPLLFRYLPRYTIRQARRREAKPGITGWAQIHGRNALSWEEKFELDVWYVENQSFLLDLRILMKTVAMVFRGHGVSQPGHATMPEFLGSQNDAREGPSGP